MDNQTLMPGSSGPFSSASPSGGGGRSPILLILVIILGLGTVLFGVLTVTFSSKATTATKTLNASVTAAVTKAKDDQKAADEEATTKANESPFRAYQAPEIYGSFVIAFPKNWSSYVETQPSGRQISLTLNPDFIRKTNSQDEVMATRVILEERTKDQYLTQYASSVKAGKAKREDITVSGLPAYNITGAGAFSGRKTIREVIVPIRDKVLIFSTEDPKFATEFAQIVAQSKIIP